jgi:excisionase family DNA binding protein
MAAEQNLLTYSETSQIIGVPLGTLYALVAQSRIPHVRLGPRLVRFRRTEIEAWLVAHSVPVKEGIS